MHQASVDGASGTIIVKNLSPFLLNIFLVKSSDCLTKCLLCSVFQNRESVVTVTPIGKAVTYVNGTVITEATVLHHVSASAAVFQHDYHFAVQVFDASQSSYL